MMLTANKSLLFAIMLSIKRSNERLQGGVVLGVDSTHTTHTHLMKDYREGLYWALTAHTPHTHT